MGPAGCNLQLLGKFSSGHAGRAGRGCEGILSLLRIPGPQSKPRPCPRAGGGGGSLGRGLGSAGLLKCPSFMPAFAPLLLQPGDGCLLPQFRGRRDRSAMGAAPCKVLCPGVAASHCPWPHLRLLIGVSNLRGELCWVSLRGLPWWEGGPGAAGSPWSPTAWAPRLSVSQMMLSFLTL